MGYQTKRAIGPLIRMHADVACLVRRELDKAVADKFLKGVKAGGSDLSALAKHGQLRTLLDPMERDWQLVSTRSKGRNSSVSVTEQGRKTLRIFGSPGA